jgi:polar amino acid transport system substrate-binding protein
MRGNFSVSIVKEKLPKPKVLLVDGNADTIRSIAQGRADALVENVDWFLGFIKKYKNVNWHILDEPILISYCGIGVGKSNENLRQYLNVLLYDLHSSGAVNEIWKKWYGAPMAVPVNENPYF